MQIIGIFTKEDDAQIAANNLEEADYKYKIDKLKIIVYPPKGTEKNAIEILKDQNAQKVKIINEQK